MQLFQESAYVNERCIDVVCELLTSSHGENDSVKIIYGEDQELSHLRLLFLLSSHISTPFLHGMICRTLFFFMLAGRFPVLMFSFIIRMLVSFWVERKQPHAKGLIKG